MKHVPVSVKPENMIVIEQDDHRGELNFHRRPPPGQSETVCKWMKEARDEAVRGERSGDLRDWSSGPGRLDTVATAWRSWVQAGCWRCR